MKTVFGVLLLIEAAFLFKGMANAENFRLKHYITAGVFITIQVISAALLFVK